MRSSRSLELRLDPFDLLRPERRNNPGLAVPDHAAIRALVVGSVENGLKIERDVWISGQQRDGDPWQPLLQPDRIDEEGAGPIEAMNANSSLEGSLRRTQ